MHISTDQITWQLGPVILNATLIFTWVLMLLLVVGSWLITRNLSTGTSLSRWQNLLEVLVIGLRDQIRQTSGQNPDPYLPFIGTLFIFIATSNLLSIIPTPLYYPPTGSLSTTAALAVCVFFAVPFFGIRKQGLLGYLRQYLKPTPIMLPFNIIGEFSRTIALAVRLFGNVMSGGLVVGILLGLVPLFIPILMQLLGLLTGCIQAYIFAILAVVYIASATQVQEKNIKGEQ
ncbi:MAG: F0F1 ATP synthase subunit A [Nostocaceae cyanobacterium]|nr:F0F1 ATP synthase subunit A [Nostocaceae cyanobacterium]